MSDSQAKRFTVLEIVILALGCAVLMSAGVMHAWLKNDRVEIGQEIDRAQHRIDDNEDTINSLQVKIEKKLNIYQLRADLEEEGSPLTKAPVSAIEKIPPNESSPPRDGQQSVAQRRP